MEELRRLRLEKGWNQTELAYHAKLAPSVISLLETGKREPNASTLRKLADALGVTIPDLFRESGSSKAPAPSSPNGGERGDQETAARAEAREETLREMEEQDAAYGRDLAELWGQMRAQQLERLHSRFDRAESENARKDAGNDLYSWFLTHYVAAKRAQWHYPKAWVPELVREIELAWERVKEFAPHSMSRREREDLERDFEELRARLERTDSTAHTAGRRRDE